MSDRESDYLAYGIDQLVAADVAADADDESYIEALARKLEVARVALGPFAECCEFIEEDEDDEEWAKFRLLIKDYRCARQALKEINND